MTKTVPISASETHLYMSNTKAVQTRKWAISYKTLFSPTAIANNFASSIANAIADQMGVTGKDRFRVVNCITLVIKVFAYVYDFLARFIDAINSALRSACYKEGIIIIYKYSVSFNPLCVTYKTQG